MVGKSQIVRGGIVRKEIMGRAWKYPLKLENKVFQTTVGYALRDAFSKLPSGARFEVRRSGFRLKVVQLVHLGWLHEPEMQQIKGWTEVPQRTLVGTLGHFDHDEGAYIVARLETP